MSINLTIVDNFLPEKEFNKIYDNISFLEWSHDSHSLSDERKRDLDNSPHSYHIWYSNGPLAPKDFLIFTEALRNKFNKEIVHCELSSWTWVNTKEPLPHIDYVKDKCEQQLIFYIKSDERINGGTAFYRQDKKGNEIDVHVGFKENRAILFESKDCLHTPLLWNSKNKTMGRYSAVFQLVVKDIHTL
tara:strand:- start:411 stop:974 length:564 start_codon:yes stop_codon:yes gene_type:complete